MEILGQFSSEGVDLVDPLFSTLRKIAFLPQSNLEVKKVNENQVRYQIQNKNIYRKKQSISSKQTIAQSN